MVRTEKLSSEVEAGNEKETWGRVPMYTYDWFMGFTGGIIGKKKKKKTQKTHLPMQET